MRVRDAEYTIKINDATFSSSDPLINGRDILNIAGKAPHKNFLIFQFLKDSQLEEIRLDEKVDLRDEGRETFMIFESDRSYRFKIDDRVFSWGSNLISGCWLYRLARVKFNEVSLWLISVGGTDKEIKPEDMINLDGNEVEYFMTRQKYFVCIEGQIHPWPGSTITAEQIAELGGWDVSQGVIAIDKDQNERQLEPGETVSLKDGLSFCKKQSFKRGLNEESRITQELKLLEQYYQVVLYKNVEKAHWFYVYGLALSEPLSPNLIKVCFTVTAGHPVSKPYGFFMQEGIKRGDVLLDFKSPPHAPPFEGSWRFKSWDAPHWKPGPDVSKGDNLWGWVRSFREAIAEGP